MFWNVIFFITGYGELPMRIFTVALVLMAIFALGLEISGFESANPLPSSFISRYVETDLYWTLLNFAGASDGSLQPLGFSKIITVAAAFSGLWFWGLYISVLVNKLQKLVAQPNDSDSRDTLTGPEQVQREKPKQSKRKKH
jgi:hypothetical protein